MSVYVDDMCELLPGESARLIADTRAELVACLAELLIRPSRIKKSGKPEEHAPLARAARLDAIVAGAIPVKASQLAAMIHRREDTGALGSPDDAEEWALAAMRAHAARMMGERA